MKQIYWGVMRGTVAQYPHSLHGNFRQAKVWSSDLNNATKTKLYWVKRFEINLKGRAIDIYKHEYERK